MMTVPSLTSLRTSPVQSGEHDHRMTAQEPYCSPLFALVMNTAKDEKTADRIAYAFLRTMFLFGLVAWGYVAAMQLRDTQLVYGTLAEWVPIRMDYVGEAAFILSMTTYFLLKFWETKK